MTMLDYLLVLGNNSLAQLIEVSALLKFENRIPFVVVSLPISGQVTVKIQICLVSDSCRIAADPVGFFSDNGRVQAH